MSEENRNEEINQTWEDANAKRERLSQAQKQADEFFQRRIDALAKAQENLKNKAELKSKQIQLKSVQDERKIVSEQIKEMLDNHVVNPEARDRLNAQFDGLCEQGEYLEEKIAKLKEKSKSRFQEFIQDVKDHLATQLNNIKAGIHVMGDTVRESNEQFKAGVKEAYRDTLDNCGAVYRATQMNGMNIEKVFNEKAHTQLQEYKQELDHKLEVRDAFRSFTDQLFRRKEAHEPVKLTEREENKLAMLQERADKSDARFQGYMDNYIASVDKAMERNEERKQEVGNKEPVAKEAPAQEKAPTIAEVIENARLDGAKEVADNALHSFSQMPDNAEISLTVRDKDISISNKDGKVSVQGENGVRMSPKELAEFISQDTKEFNAQFVAATKNYIAPPNPGMAKGMNK